MKKVVLAAAVTGTVIGLSGSAALAAGALGEFGNNCAWGLTQGQKKYTDCSIHETVGEKIYCFSKQAAKDEFMKDPDGNVQKAESFYNDN
ncbi:hypothetical protein AUC68_11390 [Methyloceanibacter methanicus]|uniref:Uncharacterized protein n=1 Tax=Methyloceanibacter methanicus TaxID=1774968 RepID=A0A1E3VX55_9HYPH|nr:hypothetical protein [Methyloceanibacter methanicus]ODR98089.1 hypothetical protein AUC68_11390 [Methyloceanibacter methanicus]